MLEEFASIIDLGAFSDEEKALIRSNPDYYNKKINDILKNARQNARLNKCYFCGKQTEGFCNSHSVPAFCLRNISENGDVMSINSLIDNPLLKKESGVNSAGTFKLICRDCDSKIFSDYENPDNYVSQPTPRMLAQIALKNNLKSISTRRVEIELYNIIKSQNPLATSVCELKNQVNNMDLQEYIIGFNKAKKAIDRNAESEYYLCYYEKLDYVVPIAFQSQIALVFDYNGNVVNNIYDKSPTYKIKNINISIFPLENSSVIFLFIEDGDKRYRSFYKQFNKLSLDDRLSSLTFIMFAYSEDMFFAKTIESEVTSCQKLCEISRNGFDIQTPYPYINSLEAIKPSYNLDNRKNIPNLLSEQYKIR